MNFASRVIDMLLDYSRVFSKAKEEHVVKSLIFYFILVFMLLIINWVILYYNEIPSNLSILRNVALTESVIVYIPLFFFLINLFSIFFIAFFIRIILRIGKIKSSFSDIVRAHSYSSVPYILTSWIPVVNAFCGLWSYYLLSRGISEYTKISFKKSIIISALGMAIAGLFIFIGIYFIMSYINLEFNLKNILGLRESLF